MENIECILCYEPVYLLGLLPCNHKTICHICIIKLCNKGLCLCPICKVASGVVLFASNFDENYEDILKSKSLLRQRVQNGMEYNYSDDLVKDIVSKANKLVCYFDQCYLTFSSMNGLKKHMNQSHKRQFCDICLENRKCLLFQQKIYTEPQITIHMNQGQVQESGTISIYHPFCDFCRIRFYDQETFIRHMKNHQQCHICNKYSCNKYIFYKDYNTLENHYQKSHFVCKHGNCEDSKMMQVFETQDLRQFHYSERHLGQQFSNKAKRKIEVMTLTGFNMVEYDQKPKDHIGICVEGQLLSVSKKLELKVEQHNDGPIDIREFYLQKCRMTKALTLPQIIERMKQRDDQQEKLSMQSIDFFQPLTMKSLSKKQISQLFQKLFPFNISNSLKKVFFDSLNDNKISFQDYCHNLENLLSQHEFDAYFFYIFPQLIRHFRDQNIRKRFMDKFYLRRLSKLPCQVQNLIIMSKTYTRFVASFIRSIESIITSRINNNTIDIKSYLILVKTQAAQYLTQNNFYVPKQKIYNLYRMIQKVPTSKALKINWLLKLGMPVNIHEYIVNTVYFSNPKNTQVLLEKLNNAQLALLYTYFKIFELCFVTREKFKFEKQKCDTNILKNILSESFKSKMPSEKQINERVLELTKQKRTNVPQNTETFTYKPSKMVVNRNQEPELPKVVDTPSGSVKKQILGFNQPRPYIPVWDQQESSKKSKIKNKHKKMTEEEQLQKALEESSSMYQKQLMKNQEMNRKQEQANTKVNRINDLLKTSKLAGKQQQQKQEQFPSLASAPTQQSKPQIDIEDYMVQSKKKKNKKWQEFDPKSVKKVWDENKKSNQPATSNMMKKTQKDQQFPVLGEQTPKAQEAWYEKIIPSKKAEIVEVKVKKKKGKVIIQQTVDIWKK